MTTTPPTVPAAVSEFLDWLVSLEDSADRRTVTLTDITTRAVRAQVALRAAATRGEDST